MENSNTVAAHGEIEITGFTPYSQTPRWIARSGKSLSLGAKALYTAIMSYADNQTRLAFPGREALSADLGVSVRSVTGYIKELEEFGALHVTRGGRNKRTGNYYPNNYRLVFQDPREAGFPRRQEAEFPLTTPNLTTSNPFTSEQSSEQMLHPRFTNRGDENKKSGELADPISPQWYASEDRQIIIRNIQAIAKAKTAKDPITAENGVNRLHDNLCTAFNSDGDGLDSLIWDYNWEPKKPQATKLAAAIWLNQLLNEWQKETPITWRGA